MTLARILCIALPLGTLGSCASSPAGVDEGPSYGADSTLVFDLGEQPIKVYRSGSEVDRRVIFVHGSPGHAGAWSHFLRDPVAGTESVALDRPGYGGSDAGSVLDLFGQARAIEPLLLERDGRWPILVGHSLGGPIITRAAAEWPDRVDGLVIVAGSLDPELEKLRWYNYVARAFSWVLPRSWTHSNREMWGLKEELLDLETRLDRITCPVVIVHGRRDSIVPYSNVEFMQRAFRNAERVELVELSEAGHFLLWQERFRDAIRKALEHMTAPGSG